MGSYDFQYPSDTDYCHSGTYTDTDYVLVCTLPEQTFASYTKKEYAIERIKEQPFFNGESK
jgi:hypothetical protein